ncbi:MAG: guanine deaminase [Pseudomonadota bacterium]
MSNEITGFRARILNPDGPESVLDIRDGMLVVDSSGRIVSCGPFDLNFQGQFIEFKNRVIIPGLIDVHSHIPQLDVRGRHGATLLKWLDRYIFPAERAFHDIKVVNDVAIRFFKKLILNGTTTAGLYSTVHFEATDRCFEIAAASGVRCYIGKVMMDMHSPSELAEDTKTSLTQSEKLCAKWHAACGGRLSYAFTPRFAPTCSMELMKGAANLASQAGAYIQTHIAETKDENQRVREIFPKHKDYVEVYEDAGILGPKTVLGHAIHLSDDEIKRLAASQAKIAHCPTSNFFLKSGRMPARKIEEAGLTYGLGTDVGAGTSMSMFVEMRHADFTQQAMEITPEKAFWLATQAGAKTLSMENDVGSLDSGKYADFCVIDITGIDPRYRLSELGADEILSLLMYRGDSRAIEAAYVAGQKLNVDAIG